MARYGREGSAGREQRGRGGTRGRAGWADEPGYGGEYRGARRGGRGRWIGEEGPGYRERPGYEAARGYGAELGYSEDLGYGEVGYGAELGYGVEHGYGEEPGAEDYGSDYEFGGRGWPYRQAYRATREGYGGRRRTRGGYGGEYDWELRRPEGFGMYYGFEYIRSGRPGFRRARGRTPGRMREYRGREGTEGLRGYGRGFAPRGYEGEYRRWRTAGEREGRAYADEYGGRAYAERYAERGMREGRGAGIRYGHTPPDRWPETGHDVDHLSREERRMSDSEIREAVLENLFQDSWVDPERIDVEVENGVVTLTGEVRDFMEARYVWDDAWESPGVRGVINNLTVRTDIPRDEMELPQTAGGRKGGGAGRGGGR